MISLWNFRSRLYKRDSSDDFVAISQSFSSHWKWCPAMPFLIFPFVASLIGLFRTRAIILCRHHPARTVADVLERYWTDSPCCCFSWVCSCFFFPMVRANTWRGMNTASHFARVVENRKHLKPIVLPIVAWRDLYLYLHSRYISNDSRCSFHQPVTLLGLMTSHGLPLLKA